MNTRRKTSITRITVSTSVLRWALERASNPSAIAQKFPALRDWISEDSLPTIKQVENLAKATHTPFGYFFLPEPPEERLPIPIFRTLEYEPTRRFSTDLLETIQTMKQRQIWMREYLIEIGHVQLSFVSSMRDENDPYRIAQEMRKILGIEEGWAANQPNWTAALRELQNKTEAIGINVVTKGIVGNNTRRKLDVAEFRGFVLVDDYAPLVFVNGSDGKAAQMFTLAHELAHVFLGASAAFDLYELQPAQNQTEVICNNIAAEFLVPESILRQVWASVKNDPEPFQSLARRFKVSEIVASRRALDLGFITKDEFLDFYRTYQAKEKAVAKPDSGNFYASQHLRIGKRFAKTVIRAVKVGRILYREAYQLTGLRGGTFERYAELIETRGTT